MNERAIGFIGGGRITRIFLAGWKRANTLPASVVVSDCNGESLTKIRTQFPSVQTTADSRAAASQDVVFMAVHPPVMAEVAAGIKGSLKPGAVVVSLAPKFTVAKLTELLGGFARLARVIPNAPSVVNFGFNPVAFGSALTAADKGEVTALLAPLGECPEVAEGKLEAYAILTAMGPTYLWYQLYQLTDLALSFGLTPEAVQPALRAMLEGTVRTMEAADLAPEAVLDLIPVRPLAEIESAMREAYVTNLSDLYRRLKA